jgi:predicted ATP-grasp superfamily ATP-dependent carboligase
MRDTLSTSILIPDGEGLLPLKVLRCLGQVPNTKISILSREKWNPIRLSKHHSGFFDHTIDEFDRKRLDVILKLAKQLKVDIILPIDQPTIRLISAYREEVQFVAALPPVAPPDTIDLAADKWHLAEVLKKESIPFPDTVLFQSKIPDEDTLRQLVFPVLAKPLEGAGGTGIKFFDNSSELITYLNSEKCPKRLIIQTFIHGYDVDCSVLCQNGEIKAYTIQKGILAGDKRFEPPSRIEFVRHEQVYNNTEKLMRALNFSGVAHIDFRYDEHSREPKVLEVNPRYWGSVIGSLVAGINFPHLACQLALKLDFPRPEYQLVHYTKPEVAFKLLLKNYFGGDKTIRKLKETGLPYTFADMGPEFIKYFAWFLARFSRN